jgi:hypothetical protein
MSQRTSGGGFIQHDIVYSDDEEEEKVEVKEGEKGEEVKMQIPPASISEDKSSIQEETTKAKETEPLSPTVAEVPPPLEEKTEEAGPSEDMEMASPPMGNEEPSPVLSRMRRRTRSHHRRTTKRSVNSRVTMTLATPTTKIVSS